ncbi:hypothetical protein J2S75_003805 [Ancylobacter polymorphus]|uniref:Uncharacterized protein n=1 Tax=Ancylobacter polymorphus TaxID=223390 RepID=A0ABU0BG01_9HYPH|nr:hypothetical protein [Ancylobacter polymorphus]
MPCGTAARDSRVDSLLSTHLSQKIPASGGNLADPPSGGAPAMAASSRRPGLPSRVPPARKSPRRSHAERWTLPQRRANRRGMPMPGRETSHGRHHEGTAAGERG